MSRVLGVLDVCGLYERPADRPVVLYHVHAVELALRVKECVPLTQEMEVVSVSASDPDELMDVESTTE